MNTISRRQLLATFVPAGFVLAIVVLVRLRYGITTSIMTGDVTAFANVHPLTGFVSSLGVLMWCTTVVACAFSAAIVSEAGLRRTFRFLFGSALLSGYLMFDDLFLVHDDLAARYLGAGEIVVFGAIAIAVATYFVMFRRDILKTDYGMLLVAFGLLAISVLLDQVIVDRFDASGTGMYFLEDGTKWLGVACWCSYFVRTAFQFARDATGHALPVADQDPA